MMCVGVRQGRSTDDEDDDPSDDPVGSVDDVHRSGDRDCWQWWSFLLCVNDDVYEKRRYGKRERDDSR